MDIQILKDENLKRTLRKYVFDILGCCQAVHREKGPELTEYVYQECLAIAFQQARIPFIKEYRFHPTFRGIELSTELKVDFLAQDRVFVECKAIEKLSFHERLQLTNYMRNAGISIGILYNFGPLHDECEKYYLDKKNNNLYFF